MKRAWRKRGKDGGYNDAFSIHEFLSNILRHLYSTSQSATGIGYGVKRAFYHGVERLHSTSLPRSFPPFVPTLLDWQRMKAHAQSGSLWRLWDME